MAFRKRFVRRRPFRRRGKPLARVRRTWVTSLPMTLCDPLEVPLGPCADPLVAGQGRIVLLDNALLESTFSDRARVKRIVGDLWFNPIWFESDPPATCRQSFLQAFTFYSQAFLGLRKLQVNAAGESLKVSPMSSDVDYSESEWLRTWQHFWSPRARIGFQAEHDVVSCSSYVCPDVHTAGLLDNDFIDGTGTINIETDCGDATAASCTATQPDVCDYEVDFPLSWHVHLDVKKTVTLREFEELVLDMNFDYSNPFTLVTPTMQIFGGIKVLLEY